MGHSVDTLVSTYVGALTGDDELANRRVDAALSVDLVVDAGGSPRQVA